MTIYFNNDKTGKYNVAPYTVEYAPQEVQILFSYIY